MKIRTIGRLFVVAALAVSAASLTPANAAGATACTVAGLVDISPEGHVLAGGFDGGFAFNGAVLVCAGTIVGTADISASGTFENQGAGLTAVEGSFSTGPDLIELPTLDSVACAGSFSGTAIGLAAVLSITDVTCGSTIAGGGIIGAAAFVPSGGGPCDPSPDVCLTQVAVAAEFVLAG